MTFTLEISRNFFEANKIFKVGAHYLQTTGNTATAYIVKIINVPLLIVPLINLFINWSSPHIYLVALIGDNFQLNYEITKLNVSVVIRNETDFKVWQVLNIGKNGCNTKNDFAYIPASGMYVKTRDRSRIDE